MQAKVENQVGHGFSHDSPPSQSTGAFAPAVRQIQTTNSSEDRDSQTLDAAYAPSIPAPPMPLTEQEQLLLQIAHGRSSTNLAMLNSAQQDVEIAREADQFQQFFAEPPAKNDAANPPADTPPSRDAQDNDAQDKPAQAQEPAVQPSVKKR